MLNEITKMPVGMLRPFIALLFCVASAGAEEANVRELPVPLVEFKPTGLLHDRLMLVTDWIRLRILRENVFMGLITRGLVILRGK